MERGPNLPLPRKWDVWILTDQPEGSGSILGTFAIEVETEGAPLLRIETAMLKRILGSSLSHRPGADVAALPSCRRLVAPSLSRAGAASAVAAACVLVSNGTGFAQTIDEKLWVTNGAVYTIVPDGGTI